MRDLYLIGESLPLDKNNLPKKAIACGKLDNTLHVLDPRHGVFPNFVMTPVLSTLFSLKDKDNNRDQFFKQLDPLLADVSDRRINLFLSKKTAKGEKFKIDISHIDLFWENLDPKNKLFAIIGYQTLFGLLAWLLHKERAAEWDSENVEAFAFRFLTAAFKDDPKSDIWPYAVERKPKTGHLGLLFRLCVTEKSKLIDPEAMLVKGISAENKSGVDENKILALLRSSIPILHNDAYRNGLIGNNQTWFVRYATSVGLGGNPDVYWRLIGRAIAHRLTDSFMEA